MQVLVRSCFDFCWQSTASKIIACDVHVHACIYPLITSLSLSLPLSLSLSISLFLLSPSLSQVHLSINSSLTRSYRNDDCTHDMCNSLTSSVTSSLGNSYRSKSNLTRRPVRRKPDMHCNYYSLSLLSLSPPLSPSLPQSSDSELLGEMMFGSMPMKLIGNSVKIHYIR